MLKKLLNLALCVCLSVSLSTTFCIDSEAETIFPNLIKDPSFEGWKMQDWTRNGELTFNWENKKENVHHGSLALKISDRKKGYSSMRAPFNVFNNRTYTYSAWVKLSDTSTATKFALGDTKRYAILTPQIVVQPNVWTNLKGDYAYTETDKVFSSQMFIWQTEGVPNASDVMWIDDFSITPKYVAQSAEISGPSNIMKAQNNDRVINYTANIFNNEGTVTDMANIEKVWSITDGTTGGNVSDITINPQTGELTIPSNATTKSLVIKATATDYTNVVSAQQMVLVSEYMVDEQAVLLASESLKATDLTKEGFNAITENLTLATTGEYGTKISWKSSDNAVVSNSGVVTRPLTGNPVVKLTATFSLGSAICEKDIYVTVRRVDNLIVNGDFENGATGWSLSNNYPGPFGAMSVETNPQNVYSGLNSIKFYEKSSLWTSISQKIKMVPGVTYDCSFMVKQASANGPEEVLKDVRMRNNSIGTSYATVATNNPPLTLSTDSFVKVSNRYTAKQDDAKLFDFTMATIAKNTAGNNVQTSPDVYLDDISISETINGAYEIDTKLYSNLSEIIVAQAGDLTASTYITNGPEDINVIMITAVYEGDKLVSLDASEKISIAAKTSKNILSNVNVPSSNSKVKVMLWDGMDTMKPLN